MDAPPEAPATPDDTAPAPRSELLWWPAWLLPVLLLAVYLLSGPPLPTRDSKASAYLGVSLLERGDLSFEPAELPNFFSWTVDTTDGPRKGIPVRTWNDVIGGHKASTLFARGRLHSPSGHYNLTPTAREGVYVCTFGIGAGLVNLPALAVQKLVGVPLTHRRILVTARFTSALLVALSTWLLFLGARVFTSRPLALALATSYGLATCAWSLLSQTLWQQSPAAFFSLLAAVIFLRERRTRGAVLCGVAVGLAVLCRPTHAVLVGVLGGAWLVRDRRSLLPFLLGGLPLALALVSYNNFYFDSPFAFGQMLRSTTVAMRKSGSAELWSTPFFTGLFGLLFSPSRGLFVYTPFLLFGLWGAWAAWRDAALRALRPISLGALALLLPACKWFDWWGGWCFGYRPLLDLVPFLMLLIAPLLATLWSHKLLRGLAGLLLVWSLGVQIIGVGAFNMASWNAQPDIDRKPNRARLWSWSDSQLVYYIENFREGRALRLRFFESCLEDPAS